jgi:hypothetical protein
VLPEDDAAAVAPEPEPGAPVPPPHIPTPEEDSIRDAASYHRRLRSMESYEDCVEKTRGLEEPIRSRLVAACGRSRRPAAPR